MISAEVVLGRGKLLAAWLRKSESQKMAPKFLFRRGLNLKKKAQIHSLRRAAVRVRGRKSGRDYGLLLASQESMYFQVLSADEMRQPAIVIGIIGQ